MGVTGGSGTNNSARTVCSVVGSVINGAGAGGKIGHSGLTACPALLQAEVASTQAISDSRAFRFSISHLLKGLGCDGVGPLDPLTLYRDHGYGVVALLLCDCLGGVCMIPSALCLSHCPALPHGDACQEQYSSQQDTGQDAHLRPGRSAA